MEVAGDFLGGFGGRVGRVVPLCAGGYDVDDGGAEDGEAGDFADGEAVRDAGAAVVAD